MKTALITLVAIAALTGCDNSNLIPPCTSTDGRHAWGQWHNDWDGPNPFNLIRYSHVCNECGVRSFYYAKAISQQSAPTSR